ncbi:MAG: ASPIC/UnbV domain-containing protein [Saprospiraceae bacterium]|nr:ASPIC/UnbV domain-containing protein [Candidatus Defluviibacterium haderslevense]
MIGTETNRAAIGSRLKFSFRDQGVLRNVYSTVNSGGSFGSTSLRREIGLGQADIIDELEITWQKTGKKQIFKNIKPNQFLIITEGNNEIKTKHLKSFDFKKANLKGQMCKPKPA